jgi:hypothetical protein
MRNARLRFHRNRLIEDINPAPARVQQFSRLRQAGSIY